MTSPDSKILRLSTSQDPFYLYLRLLLIVVAGMAAYSNTFHVPFNFDDTANILNNPVVTEFNFARFKEAFNSRRAFGVVTFQLNYFLSGSNVFGYHLANIAVHITASLLVYAMISLLCKTPYWEKHAAADVPLPVPFFTALLFAVHPVQTQAVTYIVQRFASLATLLYVAAIACYLKMRICQQGTERSRYKELGWMTGVLLSGFLAIYTKETAYTFPVAILLVEILFFDWNRSKVLKLGLGGLAVVTAVLIRILSGNVSLSDYIAHMDGITRVQTISSRSEYLFTQFRVICTYLRLLFLPANQSIDYNYTLSHSFFEWRVVLSFLLLLTIFLFSLWLLHVSRGGNPYLRLSTFGILWFFLTLTIESSILPIIDLIFEHRVYLPSIGFFLAMSAMALRFGSNPGNGYSGQRVVYGLLAISFVLAATTWKRNLVWADEVTLWSDATRKNPESARSWNNLGGALIKQREGEKALRALIKSIELDPSKADAWNNIGIALDLMGAYKDRFQRTAADPRTLTSEKLNEWLGNTHNNLGLAYELTGNFPNAEENYRSAIGFNPSLGIAYFNLGLVSAATGKYERYGEQVQILWMVDPILANRLQSRVGETAPVK